MFLELNVYCFQGIGGKPNLTMLLYVQGVLVLSGMPDAEAKPVLFCSCNDTSVHLYELPSWEHDTWFFMLRLFFMINSILTLFCGYRFTERGRLFGKREVRAIQIGPRGLFFSGDATGVLSVWKWLDPGLKELSSWLICSVCTSHYHDGGEALMLQL